MDTNQAHEFITNSRHAYEHLYSAMGEYWNAIGSFQAILNEIESDKQFASDLFTDRDQWSVNANYHYGQYMKWMSELANREVVSNEEMQKVVNDTLAEIGAAIKSIPSLAGAVLQLAQQTLSLRYGKKPSLECARMIKTQCVVEVIWEGRNHAMHWDDKKPKAPVMGMLATLSMDYQLSLEPGRNHSLAILKAMGWVNPASVANELFTLVAGCA